jgi:hypothetical protein
MLTVVLQMLIPFLHAHTGASTQFGLHLHVASTGFESAATSEGVSPSLTNMIEESPEVGVPASRESDQFDLALFNFYVLVLFAVVYAANRMLKTSSFYSVDRFAYQRFSQSTPPLSLAPPLDL